MADEARNGWLRGSSSALSSAYDTAVLDLDGVVYLGPRAVDGAPEALAHARAAGMRIIFATNNASRPAAAVASHLADLGIEAVPEDVVTSSQAVAGLIADRFGAGATVFVMGGEGLFSALAERDLVAVQGLDEGAEVVVSGYHPDLRWRTVVDASVLVGRGLPWYATNTDMTLPTADGLGPGNGALVEAVRRVTGRTPIVAGKPEPALFRECMQRTDATRPLVVGDRLDTDIAGARGAGLDSLLVLTGVTGLAELVNARAHERPTYLGRTLASLHRPQPEPKRFGDSWGVGSWWARVTGGKLECGGDGEPEDWWPAVAAAAWEFLDSEGRGADTSELRPPG